MRHTTAASAFLLLALCAAIGCENADAEKGVSWNGASRPAPAPAPAPAPSATTSSSATTPAAAPAAAPAAKPTSATSATGGATTPGSETPAAAGVGDAVPYSALRWSFGGENGSRASQSGVVISGLSCSRGGLSFRYNKDLSAWGRSRDEASDLACFFVQKGDGSWVGGKFDWISTSRSSRDFENIYSGYCGWSLAGVPNPCNVAFVILSGDCRRRSNVIAGRWAR